MICNCHDRRIDLISEFIRLAINKRKNEQMLNKISTELSQCDKKSYHFTDCVMGKCLNDNDISKSIENWRQSLASLYSTNTCSMCNDIDEQLNENFSHTLLPLIAKLENDEEVSIIFLINCNLLYNHVTRVRIIMEFCFQNIYN